MDRNAELEQALKSLSQNELETVLDALTLVAGQYEMDQADKGVYLKAPYGELIADGTMKCFAKPKRDERLIGVRMLLSDHKAFGVMRVGEPVRVSVGEFDELIGDHCIARKSRLQWWPEKEALYLYPIEEWKGYGEAREVDIPAGVQTYVEDVKGGPGSGNFGHGGRPGERGGSAPGGGGLRLIPTEEEQSRHTIDKLKEIIKGGKEELPAIVAKDTGEIIDGHHRAIAYDELDLSPPVVTISSSDYDVLKKAGFDRIEIAAATYILGGDEEFGPVSLDIQFPGADVLGRAWDAIEELETGQKNRAALEESEEWCKGNVALNVSIASTLTQAQKGFSNRASIESNEGLLIPVSGQTGIWMKDTNVPLTVAFLDDGYKVLQLTDLTPNDETVHLGPPGTTWALEASPEWFKAVEMEVGDKVVGLKGGPGSGNFDHGGRPGKRGGSAPGLLTPGANVRFGIAGDSDTFEIVAPGGARARGYFRNSDFPGERMKADRGELFYVDAGDRKRQGVGTSLSIDALRVMKSAGTNTVVIFPTTKAGRGLVGRLLRDGYISGPIKETERKSEYKIEVEEEKKGGLGWWGLPKETHGTEYKEEVKPEGGFLSISIASTPTEAQKGFSNRPSIEPTEGLLIPISGPVGIWMKDTSVPLTVAFLDDGYKVLQLTDLTPNDETVHLGPPGTTWALEASPEWFKAVEMEVGDKVVGLKGGPGSGNFDHEGRPGERGGSAPSGVGSRAVDPQEFRRRNGEPLSDGEVAAVKESNTNSIKMENDQPSRPVYYLSKKDLNKVSLDEYEKTRASIQARKQKLGKRYGLTMRDAAASAMKGFPEYLRGVGQGRFDAAVGIDYTEDRPDSHFNLGYYRGFTNYRRDVRGGLRIELPETRE